MSADIVTNPTADAAERLDRLGAAQAGAQSLFDAIASSGLIRAGVSEAQLSKEIKALAAEHLGVTRYWHKRVIRAGRNTLHPYDDNPPDRIVEPDDIAFIDLGPIFAEWEGDFGRTYVLGDDPRKRQLRDDAEQAWYEAKAYFDASPDCTGADLYAFICGWAQGAGWTFGNTAAGHLLGEFPHETLDDDEIESYVRAANHSVMRSVDPYGRPRHWILEVHFVDRDREIGAFFEQLLTLDYPER